MTGDGSIQMNIQELLTVGHNHLNVKSLRAQQRGLREHPLDPDRVLRLAVRGVRSPSPGSPTPTSSTWRPRIGLGYRRFRTNADLSAGLVEVMDSDGPWLCEVNVSPTQEKAPRIKSRRRDDGTFESAPLDDQYPYLPREEREAIMSEFADPRR